MKKILLAGGSGFLGKHLIKSLIADRHQVLVLTRSQKQFQGATSIQWDGKTVQEWGNLLNEMDVVVNMTGLSMNSWPWTKNKKQRFHDSRIEPGNALASAIKAASHKPDVFVQISGINYYGLQGKEVADESTPPAGDYLAQLCVAWEGSTHSVETLGVRWVACRTAVVLAKDAILLRLMALPARLFLGGKLGRGDQALPWIHISDQLDAIKFLIENEDANGAYNLIAPHGTKNKEFMRTLADVLHKPFWFHVPAFLLKLTLGEMNILITEGRYVSPKRLLELGYQFKFPNLNDALREIFK